MCWMVKVRQGKMLAVELQTRAHVLQEEFPEHVVLFSLACVENVVKENVAYLPSWVQVLMLSCFLDLRSGKINFKDLVLV